MLVTGAGLLGSSLVRLHQVPVGFEARGLILMPLETNKQSREGVALIRFYRDVAEAISVQPGVEAVSFASFTPISDSSWTTAVTPPGGPERELYRNRIGPDYFRSMRTPLLAGREFRWTDTDASNRVAILNQSAARALFGNADPIGQHIREDKNSL